MCHDYAHSNMDEIICSCVSCVDGVIGCLCVCNYNFSFDESLRPIKKSSRVWWSHSKSTTCRDFVLAILSIPPFREDCALYMHETLRLMHNKSHTLIVAHHNTLAQSQIVTQTLKASKDLTFGCMKASPPVKIFIGWPQIVNNGCTIFPKADFKPMRTL